MARDVGSLRQEKGSLRTSMCERLATIDAATRSAAGTAVAQSLTGFMQWKNTTEILLFVGMATETRTDPIIEAALDDGKALFLPRIDGRVMSFHLVSVDDWKQQRLVRHAYGMLEPLPQWPIWQWRDATADPSAGDILVICPGVAFDRAGNRLGHGGGFYDQFLRKLVGDTNRGDQLHAHRFGENCTVIGICYDFQLVKRVPTGPTDIRVDGAVTDKQVVWT